MHFQNKIIQEIILKNNFFFFFFLTLLWFWCKQNHINWAKYQHISQPSYQSVMCAAAAQTRVNRLCSSFNAISARDCSRQSGAVHAAGSWSAAVCTGVWCNYTTLLIGLVSIPTHVLNTTLVHLALRRPLNYFSCSAFFFFFSKQTLKCFSFQPLSVFLRRHFLLLSLCPCWPRSPFHGWAVGVTSMTISHSFLISPQIFLIKSLLDEVTVNRTSPPALLLISAASRIPLLFISHPPRLPWLSCFSLLRSPRRKYLFRETGGEGAGRSPDLHEELFRRDGEKEVEEGNWRWCPCRTERERGRERWMEMYS